MPRIFVPKSKRAKVLPDFIKKVQSFGSGVKKMVGVGENALMKPGDLIKKAAQKLAKKLPAPVKGFRPRGR